MWSWLTGGTTSPSAPSSSSNRGLPTATTSAPSVPIPAPPAASCTSAHELVYHRAGSMDLTPTAVRDLYQVLSAFASEIDVSRIRITGVGSSNGAAAALHFPWHVDLRRGGGPDDVAVFTVSVTSDYRKQALPSASGRSTAGHAGSSGSGGAGSVTPPPVVVVLSVPEMLKTSARAQLNPAATGSYLEPTSFAVRLPQRSVSLASYLGEVAAYVRRAPPFLAGTSAMALTGRNRSQPDQPAGASTDAVLSVSTGIRAAVAHIGDCIAFAAGSVLRESGDVSVEEDGGAVVVHLFVPWTAANGTSLRSEVVCTLIQLSAAAEEAARRRGSTPFRLHVAVVPTQELQFDPVHLSPAGVFVSGVDTAAAAEGLYAAAVVDQAEPVVGQGGLSVTAAVAAAKPFVESIQTAVSAGVSLRPPCGCPPRTATSASHVPDVEPVVAAPEQAEEHELQSNERPAPSHVHPPSRAQPRAPQPPEEEEDDSLCVVCLDKRKRYLIRPCGHLCLCADCVVHFPADTNSRCPKCRAVVEETLVVY